MTREQLATELRQRQYDAGKVEGEVIDALTDDQIIEAYNTCATCGGKNLPLEDLRLAICLARDAEHFIAISDALSDIRGCK